MTLTRPTLSTILSAQYRIGMEITHPTVTVKPENAQENLLRYCNPKKIVAGIDNGCFT